MAPSKQRSLTVQSSLTLALKPYLMREIKDKRGFVRNKNKCLMHALHDYIVYLEKLLVDCDPLYVTNNRNACQLVTNFEVEQEQLQEELKNEMDHGDGDDDTTANNNNNTVESVNTETASENTMITDNETTNSNDVGVVDVTPSTSSSSGQQNQARKRYYLRSDYLSNKVDMDVVIASLDHNNNNNSQQKQQQKEMTSRRGRKRKTTEQDEETTAAPQTQISQIVIQSPPSPPPPQPPTTLLTTTTTIPKAQQQQQQSLLVSANTPESARAPTPVTTPKNEPDDDEVIIVDDIEMSTPESTSTLPPSSHSSNHSTPISIDSKPELASAVKLPVSPVSMISTSNMKVGGGGGGGGNFTRDEITLDLVNEVITNQSSPLSPQDSNSSSNSATNTEQVGGCNRLYQELIAIYNKC